MTILWVLGDSGLAREVEALALAERRWGQVIRIDQKGEHRLIDTGGSAVMGLGSPALRELVAARFAGDGRVWWPTLVHPRADVGPRVELDAGVVVASGVVITVDAIVAEHTMLNLNVTVGHDSRIGHCCMINPLAAISGNVTLGSCVLVGTGAVILEGRTVGEGATVGAGAVVTKDVEPGTTVVGSPARPLRGGGS